MADMFAGSKLVLKDGSEVEAAERLKGKMVALYFSAGWCGPCRQFTPKLKRFYDKMEAEGKPFEVIFVSKDHEKEDFEEYFEEKHGDWTAVPFDDEQRMSLFAKFEVVGIPQLKVIKADGTVAVQNGKSELAEKDADDYVELYEGWEAFSDM